MATRPDAEALTSRRRISALLEDALARSPADETELVWLEARRRRALYDGARPEIESRAERTVLVRVLDRGRIGSHRTGAAGPGDLDNGIRAAIAQSRVREPLPGLPHLPSDEAQPPKLPRLRDEAISRLDGPGIEALVGRLGPGESVALRWADARVAVFNSRGLRRGVSVTAIELAAHAGKPASRGLAIDAARRLEALDPPALVERARTRAGAGEAGEPPADPGAAVLAPEAAAALVRVLNREALAAAVYHEDSSLLREHLGVQVFDRAISLRDDATDPSGLAFPFDLEGTPKRPVTLIEHGIPRTPALDQRQAAVLGLQPTAHAVGGADARAQNLFLEPGDRSEEALLAAADGGLWVGRLGSLECFERGRLRIRATLGNVRRIRDGRLAEPLPDLPWETSLLRAFASVIGVGSVAGRSLGASGYLGGVSAPTLAIRVPELAAEQPAEGTPPI